MANVRVMSGTAWDAELKSVYLIAFLLIVDGTGVRIQHEVD